MASAGLFASILMHEICHSVVALAHGLKVRSVTLFVFGGVANIEREAPTAASAFWVALAGPAFNLSLFALLNLLLLSGWIAEETPVHQIVLLLADLNLFVGIFNLLPGLPLDGGQILRALVWGITGDKAKGILWASRSGQWLGMG
ncbi:MAG: site-2 protease family protein, partial [Synechococcaceae cyanobacterium RM1_1_27]|nr:site-2 protease family protein [Synechococcaceae cyanobacterium RM1_1_27]